MKDDQEKAGLPPVADRATFHSRDITYPVFCQGPCGESIRYHDFMGWDMPWYSAQDSVGAAGRSDDSPGTDCGRQVFLRAHRPDRCRAGDDGSRAGGDPRAGRRVLGGLGLADERDGHGHGDPARLVRLLHRRVGGHDGGDDAACRRPGGAQARPGRRCARRAAVRRLVPGRRHWRACWSTRWTGRTGPSSPAW